ncbi:uncharacterized protein LODBEIA_P49010 [Lodderomyces beijingensis]|uniref:Carbamoyl phosphate synthase arginine-specific small chain n=1 Tax=Lodderomyces beijingensis TaxID=1775926 RepID=A0ABP0ZRC6_9ASCO
MATAAKSFTNNKRQLDRATLTIKNGPIFSGYSFGANKNVSGEAVFTTSLVGYPESMTDPSYKGQILCFTQPLIGNYGVPSSTERDEFGLLKYMESPKIQCAGIVVGDVALEYSHWTAVESLQQWCTRNGIAAITGVDTRELVSYLRDKGSSLGKITIGEEYDADEDAAFEDPSTINLVSKVSTKAPFHIACPKEYSKDIHVAVIDCGVKENILRCLAKRGAHLTVFPWNYDLSKDANANATTTDDGNSAAFATPNTDETKDCIASKFDAVFVTNGPGDPSFCTDTINNLRKIMQTSDIPIMGICMGHQLISLASGADVTTSKMKFGNRSANVPTLDLVEGRCSITSQNHGYAVDAPTLGPDWEQFFVNLNDLSNEGIIHKTKPIFSVQFHPEAKGGPEDTAYLFDKFFDNIAQYKAMRSLDAPNKSENILAAVLPNRRVE